uniref:Uncharacterized protein n=1 Tax=Cupriavidus taiwanensis TaxID=164546 RepID=A0A375HCU7_9BURK|nr:protein of unknown function [Cupriavidus taiwanensis]
MMEPPRLTWHRDSILPYASLSHTLHRACALNGLWPRQLALMAADWDHHGRHRPAYGIDRERLAALVGESSEKFQMVNARRSAGLPAARPLRRRRQSLPPLPGGRISLRPVCAALAAGLSDPRSALRAECRKRVASTVCTLQ